MDVFECTICLEDFKDPRVISCGHTFCKACLKKLNPNQLRCPLCQTTFKSVDLLASNFVVMKWMEENKNQNNNKNEIQCDNCEKKLAVVWCEKCEVYCCKDCDSTIHAPKATRGHIRLGLKEKSKKPTFTKCKSHMRDNEVYCVDCQSLICTICVMDDHLQHKAQSIFKFAEEKRVELKSCVAPFQNLEPLVKIEEEFRFAKEKDVAELKIVETRAQVLKNQIVQHDLNILQIINQTERVKTSHIVLINSIQEMGIMELLDKQNVEIIKKKIQDVLQEVYPELDKERLVKEGLSCVDLSIGKGSIYQWDHPRGYNIDFYGTFVLHSVLIQSTCQGTTLWINNIEYPVIESMEGKNFYKLQLHEPISLTQANISVKGSGSFYFVQRDYNVRNVEGFSVWSTCENQIFSKSSSNTYSVNMLLLGSVITKRIQKKAKRIHPDKIL